MALQTQPQPETNHRSEDLKDYGCSYSPKEIKEELLRIENHPCGTIRNCNVEKLPRRHFETFFTCHCTVCDPMPDGEDGLCIECESDPSVEYELYCEECLEDEKRFGACEDCGKILEEKDGTCEGHDWAWED